MNNLLELIKITHLFKCNPNALVTIQVQLFSKKMLIKLDFQVSNFGLELKHPTIVTLNCLLSFSSLEFSVV